jgi:predicted chitinase/N-acetyl-anhydromuramyl-L-alanine amidase AmpD
MSTMSISRAVQADKQGNKVLATQLKSGNLVAGNQAAAVRWMERMLKLAGFDPGAVDRRFDDKTTAALRAFQGARGLAVTGELDPKTFEALRVVQKRVRAAKGKKVFGVGQKDGYVKVAEARLKKLGYDVGKVDGTFDRKTLSAMRAFRADQKKIGGSGLLTEGAMKHLRVEEKALAHAPYRARVKKGLEQHRRLDALTAQAAAKVRQVSVPGPDGKPSSTRVSGLGEGDKGRAVKALQTYLRGAGFDPKRVDGVFDERTAGALRAFQRRAKLPVTGRLTPRVWKELRQTRIYAKGDASPAQRLGEKSAAVLRTEKLLKKMGLNPGKVDGIFDARTKAAVKKAEARSGVKRPDGVLGAADLKRIKQGGGVTLSQLRRVMPSLSSSKAQAYLPHLNRAMAEAGINTKQRKAMFLAQLAHESVQLRYFEEIASGAAYEGRRDLGNVRPGDGRRFKGRGPIQLTGRANYRAAGKALGLPLESNPKMASRPSVGFRVAAWFWKSRGLNSLADRGDFIGVTRRINGGTNGLADRRRYYQRARAALS